MEALDILNGSFLLKYARGWPRYDKTAPITYVLASVSTINYWVKSSNANVGVVVKTFLSCLNARSQVRVQWNESCFNISLSCQAIRVYPLRKHL